MQRAWDLELLDDHLEDKIDKAQIANALDQSVFPG